MSGWQPSAAMVDLSAAGQAQLTIASLQQNHLQSMAIRIGKYENMMMKRLTGC